MFVHVYGIVNEGMCLCVCTTVYDVGASALKTDLSEFQIIKCSRSDHCYESSLESLDKEGKALVFCEIMFLSMYASAVVLHVLNSLYCHR